MTPGFYHLRTQELGWPWPIDSASGYTESRAEIGSDPWIQTYGKIITGAHHIAPPEIADILSVKEWDIVVGFESAERSYLFEETVISGTETFRQNITPGDGDPILSNTPGWVAIKDAIQRVSYPATDVPFNAIAKLRIAWNNLADPTPDTLTARVNVEFPTLGFTSGGDPAWIIRFYCIFGFAEDAFARPTGILYDGYQLGTADTAGWTVSITPGGNYPS